MYPASRYLQEVLGKFNGIAKQLLIDLEFVDDLEPEKCKEIREQIDQYLLEMFVKKDEELRMSAADCPQVFTLRDGHRASQ